MDLGKNKNILYIKEALLNMKMIASCFVGALLVSVGMNQFLQPAGLAPGGVTGLAVLLYNLTEGLIPVGVGIFCLNVPLFWAGYRKIGKKFVWGSLLGTALCALLIDGLQFTQKYWTMSSEEPLLVCLAGGILLGTGYGLIFRGGASTGGTDILARLVQPKLSAFSLGQLCFFFDLIFLAIIFITYRSFTAMLYIGITVFLSSKLIDAVEGGLNYAKEVFVVSAEGEAIGREIGARLGRGCTQLWGKGLYSGEEKWVLWCVVYNRQLSELCKIVHRYDPKAFLTIRNVREVNGLYDQIGKM
ncbi:MAG: YitT family protein [Clostridia bacterium]|nr:YitT family protein [Clostridia bacterium]